MNYRWCATMQVFQHVKQSISDLANLCLAKHRAGLHSLQQRWSLDVFLHDVVRGAFVIALEVVEHPGNAGMLEPAEHPRLTLEKLQLLPVGDVRKQQFLYYNVPVFLQILAEEGTSNSTLTDYGNHLVTVPDNATGSIGFLRGRLRGDAGIRHSRRCTEVGTAVRSLKDVPWSCKPVP